MSHSTFNSSLHHFQFILGSKRVIIGDSLLDGRGSTAGEVEINLAESLETIVDNNAVGGYSLEDIFESDACSSDAKCTQWSVVNGGMNGNKKKAFELMMPIVDRELSSGRNVIIQGYLEDCGGEASGIDFTAFMDAYADIASSIGGVWFIDPRNLPDHPLMGDPCNPESDIYRADDNSHPSPLSGGILGKEMATIIIANSAPTTSPPTEAPGPCTDDADWLYGGKKRKNCDWVAKRPKRRCRLRSEDGETASKACEDSCGNCAEPEIININWTAGFIDPSARSVEVTKGTTLNFRWQGYHNVYKLENRDSFDNCDFSNAVKLTDESPYKYTVELETAYFACSVDSHCSEGQKLEASVVALSKRSQSSSSIRRPSDFKMLKQ